MHARAQSPQADHAVLSLSLALRAHYCSTMIRLWCVLSLLAENRKHAKLMCRLRMQQDHDGIAAGRPGHVIAYRRCRSGSCRQLSQPVARPSSVRSHQLSSIDRLSYRPSSVPAACAARHAHARTAPSACSCRCSGIGGSWPAGHSGAGDAARPQLRRQVREEGVLQAKKGKGEGKEDMKNESRRQSRHQT